jgi:hypothetical protein
VNKTTPNVDGGGQVAIEGGMYPFTVVDKGVNKKGEGKGLVPKLRNGRKIPTLRPNAAQDGNSVADGVLIHSMNHAPKEADPKHGGEDYYGSEGCNGPTDGGKSQLEFMDGSAAGDKGTYLLIRPGEAVDKAGNWLKGLFGGEKNGDK